MTGAFRQKADEESGSSGQSSSENTDRASGDSDRVGVPERSEGMGVGCFLIVNQAGTTFVSYDAGGGTCTAPSVGSIGTLNCGLAQLNSGTTWYVKLTVNVGANSGTTLSNMAATISNMQDFVTSNNSATITTHVN
jgi:hypothetical protein